ncbi:MAG: nucleotidyl transferase AbiEii/AbiGii toxin family protein, partial [Candidatus Omnitrophota bacterium]
TDKSVLFADKIDALFNKNRARDIYDIIFMLSNKYPVDKNALKLLGVKIDPDKAIYDAIKKIPQAELKKQAEILRPFLFEESEADLILNAQKIIPALLEKYNK